MINLLKTIQNGISDKFIANLLVYFAEFILHWNFLTRIQLLSVLKHLPLNCSASLKRPVDFTVNFDC